MCRERERAVICDGLGWNGKVEVGCVRGRPYLPQETPRQRQEGKSGHGRGKRDRDPRMRKKRGKSAHGWGRLHSKAAESACERPPHRATRVPGPAVHRVRMASQLQSPLPRARSEGRQDAATDGTARSRACQALRPTPPLCISCISCPSPLAMCRGLMFSLLPTSTSLRIL
jgi:hypothetical protein